MKLFVGTNNRGKQEEISSILKEFELLFPQDLNETEGIDPVEKGKTLKENAFIKAKTYYEVLEDKVMVFADDTGLEVEALNGQPGVHSARWVKGSDQDRNEALLKALKPFNNRKAQFRTVIAFIIPDMDDFQKDDFQKYDVKYFQGKTTGRIVRQPHGSFGFGYDPLFQPKNYRLTYAQMGSEKNKISHRKKALFNLRNYLSKQR